MKILCVIASPVILVVFLIGMIIVAFIGWLLFFTLAILRNYDLGYEAMSEIVIKYLEEWFEHS